MADFAYRVCPARPSDDPYWVRLSWNAQAVESILRRETCNHGRICADPLVLHRGALGALSVDEIGRVLDEIEEAGFIERYDGDGVQWLWFPDTDQMHVKKYLEQDRPWSPYPAPPGYVDPKGEPPARRRRGRTPGLDDARRESPGSPPGVPRESPGSPPGVPRESPGSPPGVPRESPGPAPSGTRNQEPGTRTLDADAARAREAGPGSPPEAGPELLAVVEAPEQPPDTAPLPPEPPWSSEPPAPPAPPAPEPEQPVPRDARFAALHPFAERWRVESHYPETGDQVVSFAARVERERGHPVDWALVVERANGRAGPRGRKVESASALLLRWVDTADKAREFEPWREVAHGRQRPEKAGGGAGRGKRNHTCDFPNDWGNRLDELA